jgi:hypothetical protein
MFRKNSAKKAKRGEFTAPFVFQSRLHPTERLRQNANQQFILLPLTMKITRLAMIISVLSTDTQTINSALNHLQARCCEVMVH